MSDSIGTRTQLIDPFNEETWDEDAKTYFGIIDKACDTKKDALLSNGQPAHAAYIIHKFLENAEHSVRLYSGSLLRVLDKVPVYENPHIINDALTFLKKPDTSLSVVLEGEIDIPSSDESYDHPLIRAVKEAKKKGKIQGHLRVCQALEEHVRTLREAGFAYHWMVMDEQAYRLEKDPEKATAFVNFGNTEKATRLGSLFDKIAQYGEVLYQV